MTNRDTIVSPTGNGGIETYWFGYQAVPDWAPGTPPRAYPFTEERLLWMIGQVIPRYSVDPNHVSCFGYSMGAWGATSFCLRHPELFSAVYPDRPRPRQFGLPSLVATPAADQAVMSDGTTPYLERMDSVKYVSEHHEDLPFFVWDVGRQDGYGGPWQNQVDLVAAFEASHHGFAFIWNNGDHSGTAGIADEIQTMYPPAKFSLVESYPAFSNSSLDGKLGNGDPTNGDLEGGINLGFDWSAIDDEPNRWSASISNSSTAPLTVDVTPRRCQKFHLQPGDTVTFTTSTGGAGTAVADAWGLVTIPKVAIAPSQPTVVTVTH
jgi:pimeloyl-ACP methyl ester carboxylesterase